MRVEVSGRQFNFPPHCACCGAPANTTFTVAATKTTGKKVVHTSTNTWDFPYCSACIAHIKAIRQANATATALGIGTIVLALFCYLGVAPWLGVLISFLGAVGTIFIYNQLSTQAKALCGSTCACVTHGVAFLNWDGTQQVFEIVSQDYALDFMIANQKKLVNVSPQARQLMEAYGYGAQVNTQQTARRSRT